ncbi:hypothetical protein FBZ81_11317 [Azospirillum brasilense]|nr:hypothetical protein OH82_05646 [Azospirillum brasilense]TWB74577.1 hypothetical protein FBZ81_11317 [Azospirillum brasilense]
MRRGILYLVVVMDWAIRRVLAWRLSNIMDVEFGLEAVEGATARHGRPEILNTDQGRLAWLLERPFMPSALARLPKERVEMP